MQPLQSIESERMQIQLKGVFVMGEKIYAKEPVTAEELAEYGNHIVQYSPSV